MRRVPVLIGIACVVGCSSSTGPHLANPALLGTWLDSTSFFGQANILTITGSSDSVTAVSPEYYLRSFWDGITWWQPEASRASASGTVTKDSVALCDPGVGVDCPNEIGYLRSGVLVLYLAETIDGTASDSAGLGSQYVHETFAPNDSIGPSNAPPALQFAGVWLSDSMPSSCMGSAQVGLVVSTPVEGFGQPWLFQLYDMFSYPNEMVRTCDSISWNPASTYFADISPNPCTPADECSAFLLDTVTTASDFWFLGVATDDSLVDDTTNVTLSFVPSYFLRDSGATSLARARSPTRGRVDLVPRMVMIRAAKRAAVLRRRRRPAISR